MNNVEIKYDNEIIIKKLSYLLKYKLGKYTINSSVKINEVSMINESNIYTLNNYLKNKDKINILLNEDIISIYNKAYIELNSKVFKTKLFYNTIFKNNLINIDNYFYIETLNTGIKYFFKLYNTSYDASNTIITVDYNPVLKRPNESGINFISEYLNYINYENIFLNKFNINKINNLIREYKDIPINILEIVLETVLLLEYQDENIFSLDRDILNIEKIYNDKDILDKLNKSYLNIKKILNINNNYIDLCSEIIIKNILYKIEHKTLIQSNKEILYKPNDNLFNILDNKSNNEILSILKTLNVMEIMILKNNYIFNDNIINVIDSYINTLTLRERNIINNNYMNIRIIEYKNN